MSSRLFLLLLVLSHGLRPCDSAEPASTITAKNLAQHIQALASDDFEGRAPGSRGEEKTVSYLVEQLHTAGLKPGNPDGTFVQPVPLAGFVTRARVSLEAGKLRMELKTPEDSVIVSRRSDAALTVRESPIVFVGYGVVAPEYGWDDFKGVDLRGKTVIMLIGDPPVADPVDPARLDNGVFGGPAMTYYGRWTYKYEIAGLKGAEAAIIMHETGPAGYGWGVVSGSWHGENFDLDPPGAGRAKAEAWITESKARELARACGRDLDALKKAALSRDFVPVPLAAAASFEVSNQRRSVVSHNVLGVLEGSDPVLKSEYVAISAHWDHFGRKRDFTGDQIINGALDNASGLAIMLELARAFGALPVRPRRSLLFLAPTAEEQGLLGAEWYAGHPLQPLDRIVADVNMDMMNVWGRCRGYVTVGLERTTIDEVLAAVASEGGRRILPDPDLDKGYFYRSDHFALARRGVPAIAFLHPCVDYADKPPGWGRMKRDEYLAQDYHKVTDEMKSDWDLGGTAEDARLLFEVVRRLADSEERPRWKGRPPVKPTEGAFSR